MVDTQKELENCAFVKTALMLLVVFYHSILFWSGKWYTADPVFSSGLLAALAYWLNTVHIYGFALVSGYLFRYGKEEAGKYSRFVPFLIRKAKRLLVPYVFAAVCWCAPVWCAWQEADPGVLAEKFLLATGPEQLWFLWMLFDVFVLVWPLSGFLARHQAGSMVLGLAFYGIGVAGPHLMPNYFQIWTACRYVVFFLLGYKLRQWGSGAVRRIPWYVWVACSGLLCYVTHRISGGETLILRGLSVGLSLSCNLVGALMAFVVLQKAADLGLHRRGKIFSFLRGCAMPVFLFHQQFVYFFLSAFNGALHPYLHGAVTFLGALSLSLLVSAALMKYKWTRFLIGEQ